MAVYKVIQDIEAEDKFVGPLTLKQFIFACITVICLYLSFIFIVRGLWFLVIPLVPVIFVGGFLSFPWGRDQPTEIWLLAKLRFLLKTRRRVWDQSGMQELVTITAPKRDETQYTNNLSQTEVKSRLRALADTIDSRGWAIKNVNTNLYNPALSPANNNSDRLVAASSLPQEVPTTEVYASDDIMDAQNNPLAQHFDELINDSSASHRQAALDQMEKARSGADEPAVGAPAPNYWFINQPDPSQLPAGAVPAVDPAQSDNFTNAQLLASTQPGDANDDGVLSPEEQALLENIHKQQDSPSSPIYGHMRVIQPLSVQARQAKAKQSQSAPATNTQPQTPVPQPVVVKAPQKPVPAPVTPAPNPAILELAINNDRDVASLAREANAIRKDSPNEVVIKLR